MSKSQCRDDYQSRPKATASNIPLLDPHGRVRHDVVDGDGKLTLRHNSRLHHLGIGRRHRGKPVLMLVQDLNVRVITHTGEILATFVINPDRDYQPQPKT